MVTSSQPLIRHGRIAAEATYKELLKLDSNPDVSYYIRDITITFSAVAATTYITLSVNGVKKLRDFRPLATETTLSFGGDLVFHGKTKKPPITIKVKDSATPNVTAVITGVELPYKQEIGVGEELRARR